MGTVRNNISIEGLSLAEEFPKKNNGQLITYSETDNLHIPDCNPEAKGIYEISIEVDIVSKRVVSTGVSKIIILDGLKKYKILYIENNEASSASILYLEAPYNTFVELPLNVGSVSEMNIHILDAYYQLTDNRNIYEHLIFLLDIHHDQRRVKKTQKSLIEREPFDESLLRGFKAVSNVLNEAALASEDINEEQNDLLICFRSIDEVFM